MMRRPLLILLLLCFAWRTEARAQFGSFGDVPVEVNAAETRFENGVAIAEHDVVIQYGDVTIYSDYAQYNPDTRDVLVTGNVRIYRQDRVFAGERAIYNLETKQLTGSEFHGRFEPYEFSAETLNTIGPKAYRAQNVEFTTSDNSKPDYFVHARSARIYPGDRIIFRDVFLYVGKVPVFWFPYVYQSLKKENAFTFTPGYSKTLGAHLFTKYTFPLTDELDVKLRFDLMSTRGVGIGLETDWRGTDKREDWGRFRSYYVQDAKPEVNTTGLARETIAPERYRVSFQAKTYLTEDIYSQIDINKLSDARFLQDFVPGEFRTNPNPDNAIALTRWHEDYTITLLGREQVNQFLDTTERLPELALDVKRQPIFGSSGFFYEGQNSTGYLRRNFASDSIFPDYETFRLDSFHQIVYPKTLFGWLAVVPKVGIRGTYYSKTGHVTEEATETQTRDAFGNINGFQDNLAPKLTSGGSTERFAANAGLEMAFKFSRAYEGAQSRDWGLDGLRHVVQPYLNMSYVYSNKSPRDLLQFDRVNPSTQLPAIDFPQFSSIDSIDNWAILQLGLNQRLQTRRDNYTYGWLDWSSYVNVNLQRPKFEETFLTPPTNPAANVRFNPKNAAANNVADPGTFSNVYNRLHWSPLPWASLSFDSQLPLLDTGFTEINTSLNFLPTENLQLTVAHRYLSGNVYFGDSNQLTVSGYYRLSDNWGLGAGETYEFITGNLIEQRYEVHRDLSSWVATLGFVIQDNGSVNNYGIALSLTLKDLPQVRLPFTLNPDTVLGGTGKNP